MSKESISDSSDSLPPGRTALSHRILMLSPDGFSGFGGIAQYNRDLVSAITSNECVSEVVILPRNQCEATLQPTKVKQDFRASGSICRYIRTALLYMFGHGNFSFVYCAHVRLLPVAIAISKVRGIPLILGIYGVDVWSKPSNRLVTLAARSCNYIISISSLTLDRFQGWAGSSQSNMFLLPNAVHLEDYGLSPRARDLEEALGLTGHRVISTFGRISASERYKGFDEVIDVLPQVLAVAPDVVYLVLGDGDDRARLEQKVKSAGLREYVRFVGFIPESRKADYLRLSDLYVMPSYGEGFGFVILEALACGVPVVGSKADGTREALMNGQLGELVDPKTPDELLGAILRRLDLPKRVPRELVHFSFENFSRRVDDILRNLLVR